MKETKVLMVICDPVSEPTLREFLLLGGYQFSLAYVQKAEPEEGLPQAAVPRAPTVEEKGDCFVCHGEKVFPDPDTGNIDTCKSCGGSGWDIPF
jgi:hypothetical protein